MQVIEVDDLDPQLEQVRVEVLDLVLVDAAEPEVAGLRVREVEAAHRGRRQHREVLGDRARNRRRAVGTGGVGAAVAAVAQRRDFFERLPARRKVDAVVVVGIAGVVGVLVSVLAMSEGFRHTLASTGRGDRVIRPAASLAFAVYYLVSFVTPHE